MYTPITCPKCGSSRIFKFRLDSDWAYGAGDYHIVNDESLYTKEDLELDSTDRPSVDMFDCRDCGNMW